jgi:cytochrome c553
MLDKGAAHFDAMCRMCHGAPGKEAAPWELYPPAPNLAEALREAQWTDSDVFWIIKNGIKDTAMPAFADAHDDADLWTITAMIRKLSVLTPEQYAAMVERGNAANPDLHKYDSGHALQGERSPAGEPQHRH